MRWSKRPRVTRRRRIKHAKHLNLITLMYRDAYSRIARAQNEEDTAIALLERCAVDGHAEEWQREDKRLCG